MNLARRMLAAGLLGRRQAVGVEPVASDVSISGYLYVGETLTGSYTYSDPDGSAEGTSTFRWLRDGVAIDGATSETYELVEDDVGADITFEVTPVSVSAPTTGTPVVSDAVGPIIAAALVDGCEVAWTGVTGIPRQLVAAPTDGGTGYAVNDILTIVEGSADSAQTRVQSVSGGVVTDVSDESTNLVRVGGFGGYTAGSGKATTGGSGSGCTVQISSVVDIAVTLDTVVFQRGSASVKFVPSNTAPKLSLFGFRAITPPDLSSFTKLRFRLRASQSLAANRLRLGLCSDSAGRVVVHEFVLPALTANTWQIWEIARTGGGSLSGTIGSIMIGSNDGFVSSTLNVDDIWAIP